MDWLAHLGLEKFLLFTLIFARVSGLVMTAPVYGTPEVPLQIRGLLAFALALLVAPSQWHVVLAYPGTLVNYLVFLGSELAIGLVLGLGVSILFSGTQLAGQVIGQTSGLSMAEFTDPASGENESLFSRLLFLVAVAVFVAIGGHRMVMAGLLDTFKAIPPGSAVLPQSLSERLVTLVAQSFSLGIRAAAPVLASLLLANLVLGLIGRTLPQLNLLVLGFGMNSLLTAAILSLSLGAAVWIFQGQVEPAVTALVRTFAGGG